MFIVCVCVCVCVLCVRVCMLCVRVCMLCVCVHARARVCVDIVLVHISTLHYHFNHLGITYSYSRMCIHSPLCPDVSITGSLKFPVPLTVLAATLTE